MDNSYYDSGKQFEQVPLNSNKIDCKSHPVKGENITV